MKLVAKLMGSHRQPAARPGKAEAATTAGSNPEAASVLDGAIDTLGSIYRTFGDTAFHLENDMDPQVFRDVCAMIACHVENGSAVPGCGIDRAGDGARNWSAVRRFFAERRRSEKAFVTERLQDYRGVVKDLTASLRQIGQRDRNTEAAVRQGLDNIEHSISHGTIDEIRSVVDETVRSVTETFAQQQREYEAQITELKTRLSSLRQDLIAAREEMVRDTLTDAFNRGAFDTAIVQTINTHFVLNVPIAFILVDLDNFKQINDGFGHSVGDEVLRRVGECLARSFIRKSDFVARYGGDEFAIILNDTTADSCQPLIDRLCELLGQIAVPGAPPGLHVTCSAGFTEVAAGDTVRSLINRADAALYEAKSAGRNRSRYRAPEARYDDSA